MTEFSPFFLQSIGYENFSPERKAAFEKSLDELGYCIRAVRASDLDRHFRRKPVEWVNDGEGGKMYVDLTEWSSQ